MAVTTTYKLTSTSTEFVANGFQQASQFGSTVIALANGGYAVAYGNNFGLSNTPHVSLFGPDGTPVAGPLGNFFLPYSGSAAGVGMRGAPKIVQLSDGNLLVTWIGGGTASGDDIYSTVIDSLTGTTLKNQRLVANAFSNIENMETIVLANDARIYTVEYNSVFGLEILTRNFNGDSGSTYAAGDDMFEEENDFTSVALTDGSGRFAIVYTQVINAQSNEIYYQLRKSNGTADGAPARLSATGTSVVDTKPVLAALPDGGFAMAYCDSNWDGDGISLMIVTASDVNPAPIGPIRVDTNIAAIEKAPSIAVMANGFILVTWTHPTSPGNNDILGRVFNSAGVPVEVGGSTNPFFVERDASDDNDSSIAVLASGQFVTTWTDADPDAQGDSIHGRTLGFVLQHIGDAAPNTINGDAIADFMTGAGGNDILSGGGGQDDLQGGEGNDRLDGGTGIDKLVGGFGNDTYLVDDVNDRVFELAGQGTTDRVLASASYALKSNANIEILAAEDQSSTALINLTGNALSQRVNGNAGRNVLADGGGAGADVLTGFGGNDTYVIKNAASTIVERVGQGVLDKVVAAVSFALAADDHIELLSTNSPSSNAPINLTGNKYAQRITGNAGENTLSDGGGTGADTLEGLCGSDSYLVMNAATQILEAANRGTADHVFAGVSYKLAADARVELLSTIADVSTLSINLTGNAFSQTISGNSGANIIDGAAGIDVLTGGLGADTFVFSSKLSANNIDTLTDFDGTSDKIALRGLVFGSLGIGAISAEQFESNSTGTATTELQRIIYDNDSGFLYFDRDGSGSTSAIHFATLTGTPILTSTDFEVF
jgi:Ca2+-binding RTX toxin-like protein